VRLVGADREVAAPSSVVHRRATGDEVLRRKQTVTTTKWIDRAQRREKDVLEMRKLTSVLNVSMTGQEEERRRRNRHFPAGGWRKESVICA
jgi:hypothetical protein